MNNLNDLRRIFLFAAALYLVLAAPRLHAMQPGTDHLHGPSLDGVISSIQQGMASLAEAQQASNAFFPGN